MIVTEAESSSSSVVLALPGVESGSGWPAASTSAMFVKIPGSPLVLTVTSKRAMPLAGILGIDQIPVPELKVP